MGGYMSNLNSRKAERGQLGYQLTYCSHIPNNAKRFKPLLDNSCAANGHQINLSVEELRKDFVSARRAVAACLTQTYNVGRGRTVYDAYMEDTGRYDAIAGILLSLFSLSNIKEDVLKAKKVLDLTCATGVVSQMLVGLFAEERKNEVDENKKNKQRFIFVLNDVPKFVDKAKKRFSPPEIQAFLNIENFDLRYSFWQPDRNDADLLATGKFDFVFWCGSIHLSASRGFLMGKIFNLLRPRGWFFIIDEYPWITIPQKYVGDAMQFLSALSRPLDMGSHLKAWVIKQWTEAMAGARGQIVFIELDQPLDKNRSGADCTMKCLGFRKPDNVDVRSEGAINGER
jgi:SAM-dependent methyltransferase